MTIAATKDQFDDMIRMLDLLSSSGVKCERLLNKLEEYFLLSLEHERRIAHDKYEKFSRGSMSLKEALRNLR